MELPDGSERDVQIHASPGTQAQGVTPAIVRHIGLTGQFVAVCWRDRNVFDGRAVASLGIRNGDRIVLVPTRTTATLEPTAPFDLKIVTSDIERVLPLPTGPYIVGRDPARATIVIPDATVSGAHASLEVTADSVAITDLGSTNGTALDGRTISAGETKLIRAATRLKLGETTVEIGHSSIDLDSAIASDGSVPFNRPPRAVERWHPPAIDISAPPADQPRRRIPLASSLIPLVIAVPLAFLPGFGPAALVFALMSPAIALASYWEERLSGRGEFKKAAATFRERVAAADTKLSAARDDERRRRFVAAPGPQELAARAKKVASGLWERRPTDDDFLTMRLGLTEIVAASQAQIEAGGNEDLRSWAEGLLGKSTLPDVPGLAQLREIGSLGMAGSPAVVDSVARWIVMQAAVLHSPRDLLIGGILAKEDAANWDWLKWLPHVRPAVSPVQVPLVATSASGDVWVREMRRLMQDRIGRTAGLRDPSGSIRPWLLLLVGRGAQIDRATVAPLLSSGLQAGIVFLWVAAQAESLPGDCRSVVMVEQTHKATIRDAVTGSVAAPIEPDEVGIDDAREMAMALAPLVDVASDQATGSLPPVIGLFDVLSAERPIEDWLRREWGREREGLSVPIGAGAGGYVHLDIERQGPHGLIAGTTGSGKSELLQTIVGGMAALHPPGRVNFLLIDYKGGTAFRECAALPHTVGLVTDLDAGLTKRALVSLNAEIRRRERLLDQYGAKDVHGLRAQTPSQSIPSLCIVVDEFATLHQELPDFLAGLVDVAQRGRALGVHLILATQSPSGVVGSAIRANIGFRIALRTADTSESQEVIGSDLAARITDDRPGRGYARFGNRDPVPFQSAFAGELAADDDDEATVEVEEFGIFHKPKLTEPSKVGGPTHLTTLVTAAQGVAESEQLDHPHRPWVEPLSSLVPLNGLAASATGAPFGLVDEPQLQRQSSALFDLATDGGLVVYGGSGSGKTTLLRTLVASLASRLSPGHLNIYGLDYGAGGLRTLEELPHVGTIARADDLERGSRILKRVAGEIAARKAAAAEDGEQVSSVDETGSRPRLVIVIDGFEGFVSTLGELNHGYWGQALPELMTDGRAVGVHFLVTVARRAGTPSWIASMFDRRIVLRQTDPDDYGLFGLRVTGPTQMPPGRGYTEQGNEFQSAVLGDGSEKSQIAALHDLGAGMKVIFGSTGAPPVGTLPNRISLGAVSAPTDNTGVPIGISEETLMTSVIEPTDGHFLVLGGSRSGRTNTLLALAVGLRTTEPRSVIHYLTGRDDMSNLGDHVFDRVAAGSEAVVAYLESKAWEDSPKDGRVVLLLDDCEELLPLIDASALTDLARRRSPGAPWIVVSMESDGARRAYSEFLGRIKRHRHGLVLKPDVDIDGDLFGVRFPRRPDLGWPLGRAYVVRNGDSEVIQIALAE